MDLSYSIIRSGRKTLCIQITPDGKVTVRAPLMTGERKIAEFVRDHSGWIEKKLAEIAMRPKRPSLDELDREETARLKEKAMADLLPRLRRFSDITGLVYSRVRINSARRRFGSCNSSGGICLSCRLMFYPPEARDYVVLHELVHTKHMDHAKNFYLEIKKYMPDYKERIKMLR